MKWQISEPLVNYPAALEQMNTHVNAIADGTADEKVWLLEHPPLYTAGTSAVADDLLDTNRFPVYEAGRGGEHTYHGPGQRVAYVMLNLRERSETPDIRGYVRSLEQWIINSLSYFDIKGERRDGRVGIWVVNKDGSEDKIAAIGVRVRKWVTFHGISINVSPELEHFTGIVPCGISQHGVTSFAKLGKGVDLAELDKVLIQEFDKVFGD
jgi:lipoyl(octanoyl) transferase